jgi:hypothetical protein
VRFTDIKTILKTLLEEKTMMIEVGEFQPSFPIKYAFVGYESRLHSTGCYF